ncbi:hypothetical protein SEA_SAPO_39 [Gordonia phage Sapo]|nr:hypothetical protein SEA_SAPO_39 [Gordonia phage Sapo]
MAGDWFVLDPEVLYTFDVAYDEEFQYLDGRRLTTRSDVLLTVTVDLGTEGSAKETLRCREFASLDGKLYVKPTRRPLLVCWDGSARPNPKEKDE